MTLEINITRLGDLSLTRTGSDSVRIVYLRKKAGIEQRVIDQLKKDLLE